jgi:predicted kinase
LTALAKFPRPSLVVLVGAIGAGKTTWALRNFPSNEVVSLSTLRGAVGENDDDRKATGVAYELLERIIDVRLGRGLSVVVDTDGLDDGRRSRWLTVARASSVPTRAVLFTTDVETCLSRDARRPSPHPATIIRRQAARCTEMRPVLEHQGYEVREV